LFNPKAIVNSIHNSPADGSPAFLPPSNLLIVDSSLAPSPDYVISIIPFHLLMSPVKHHFSPRITHLACWGARCSSWLASASIFSSRSWPSRLCWRQSSNMALSRVHWSRSAPHSSWAASLVCWSSHCSNSCCSSSNADCARRASARSAAVRARSSRELANDSSRALIQQIPP
jgi:hypothetical protein